MGERNDLIRELTEIAQDRHGAKNTHLLSWLEKGYFHCQYGSEEWCQGDYLDSARAYIERLEAVAKDALTTIATLSEALAEAEKKGAAWMDRTSEPELGRKVIALFDDGSGSMLLFRHDDGYIDQEGDEHSEFPPHLFLWRYLPDDFAFWCENTSEPLTLNLPPRDLSQGGQHG